MLSMSETEHEVLFTAQNRPEVILMRPNKYIVIDKKVLAESQEALLALKPLYALCEMVVSHSKQSSQPVGINPLEGVWSLIDKRIGVRQPSNIIGNFMIMQPESLTEAAFDEYKSELISQHQEESFTEYLEAARLVTIDEGKCIKMLHVGPYSAEQSTFDIMEAFAKSQNLRRKHDYHREAYIKDLRTVTSDKFETVLKFQVE